MAKSFSTETTMINLLLIYANPKYNYGRLYLDEKVIAKRLVDVKASLKEEGFKESGAVDCVTVHEWASYHGVKPSEVLLEFLTFWKLRRDVIRGMLQANPKAEVQKRLHAEERLIEQVFGIVNEEWTLKPKVDEIAVMFNGFGRWQSAFELLLDKIVDGSVKDEDYYVYYRGLPGGLNKDKTLAEQQIAINQITSAINPPSANELCVLYYHRRFAGATAEELKEVVGSNTMVIRFQRLFHTLLVLKSDPKKEGSLAHDILSGKVDITYFGYEVSGKIAAQLEGGKKLEAINTGGKEYPHIKTEGDFRNWIVVSRCKPKTTKSKALTTDAIKAMHGTLVGLKGKELLGLILEGNAEKLTQALNAL